jgi:hypothetical protein
MSVLTFMDYYANVKVIPTEHKNMTLELTIEPKTNAPSAVESELEQAPLHTEEDIRAFAARVFKVYEKTMSDNERLSALYQVDRGQFEDEIDDAVDDYLNEDPDYQEFFARFKKARMNGGADSFVPEMKSRHAQARELIMNSLNLPDNSRIVGIEESQKHIGDLLKDIPRERQNANLALSTLGAKVEVEDTPGEYVYSFPYDILPEKVNNKWAEYLETVKSHMSAAENITPETRESVNALDRTRKYAHDGITKTMHSLLQLDQFGVTEKETREVLAKMRNDELMLARQPHKSVHQKTPEEIAIANKLARRSYHH